MLARRIDEDAPDVAAKCITLALSFGKEAID
jgi:hypothetical protein